MTAPEIKDRCSAKRIALITAISVTTAAALTGIALAVYFTWPKEATVATLIGNFTILQKTISEVSDSSICSYLTEILSASQLSTISCSILDKRSGSVKVRYKLIIKDFNVKDELTLLNLASSAIAEGSSDNSTFTVDQNSIVFEIESGVVRRFCYSTSCVGANVVCISVVGGYRCSCSTGYSRVNGICVRARISNETETEQRYCNATGTFIPKEQICDKFQDCPDDSDEINCACNSTYQYPCRNGRCIYKHLLCDGFKDCPQGDDEISSQCDCNTTYQYHCMNGRCIYKEWLCDGVNDCPQGDDEIPPQCAECTSSEFRCEQPRKCISSNMRCDGHSDCVDSSDESRCEATLIGNFTILQKTISEVSDSSICSYLTEILSASQLSTNSCSILDKRSGSVKVRYELLIIKEFHFKEGDEVLNMASSAIAEGSSDNSTFTIDQASIIFEIESGVVQRFCDSTPCVGANVVCISVVGGYHCSCSTGYTRDNGICSNVMPRYCNETGTTIPRQQICDKFQDCPDDSDEINCVCNSTYQYSCMNGRCIYKEWLCDGVEDCPQGDDEIPPQCVECPRSEFRCERPRKCISSNMQCDGHSDCVDSSDESRCVDFDGIGSTNETRVLTATYNGISGYRICSNGWNTTWSNWLCNAMGFESALVYSSVPISGPFLTLTVGNSSSNLMAFLNPGTCTSQQAVAIGCKPTGCGSRNVDAASIGPYILNGQRAARGAWPWQVVVYLGYFSGGLFNPISLCGGILIDRRWILTAAHCIQITDYFSQIGYTGQARPGNIQVLLGTISLNDNPDMITAYADQVHTHPQYDAVEIDNDVGLIRLSQPVTILDTVRPICLPGPDQDLSRFKVCVNTGFGRTLRNTVSQNLLQAKMNIIPDSECIRVNPYYRNLTQICIGTIPTVGDINICSGDSGGPLSCQDPNGVWTVIGVNSYVLGFTDSNRLAVDSCQFSVVARVNTFLDWINTTMSTNAI